MSRSHNPIQANDLEALWRDAGEDAVGAMRRVGESGWYILGDEVKGFESALASYWGLPHAVGCANGMDAIEISLRALGLEPGDKVLTTPLSAFATTLAIVRAGGVPVFVDTDERGLLDLGACRAALAADPSIGFLVPVHLFGFALDLTNLESLRDEFGLKVVVDCAQAIGATSGGRQVGGIGQMAITSFYPTKNLGAIGDAGALLTGDESLATAARALRDYGQSAKYVHDRIGLNSRLDELHAAILKDAMLPRLDGWTARRREIATRYLAEITHPRIQPLGAPEGIESVWHLFPIVVETGREALLDHLKEGGICTGVHYPVLIPYQAALATAPHEIIGGLPNAERLAAGEISLPLHPFLSDDEIGRVISCANTWNGP